MKTKSASLLVLAAVLSVSFTTTLNAAPKSQSAHAISVRTVDNNRWEVSRGTTERTLVKRFGLPDEKLSEDVWVYQRFHAVQDHPQARECTILVVTITAGVITNLHLVNERAQAIITARVHTGSPALVASTR